MTEEEKKNENTISEEFKKLIKDFILDIVNTFPEVKPLINKWWKDETYFLNIEDENERKKSYDESQEKTMIFLFNYCNKKLPPRFFDILYQNEEIFKEDSEIDTEFLPHIHFKNLWNFDITQKTKETIWKYLQLILFSIIGTLKDKELFGDTAKLFEGINENEFRNKLEETLSNMQNLFNFDENEETNDEQSEEESSGIGKGSINMDNIPNAKELHEHITGMLDGKLGRLATEIAEETASEFNIDMENINDTKNIFSNLMKNPTKLMGLVKNIGDKLDKKIKSGEIKESELILEATEMMNKMKNMGGMDGMGDIQAMLSKMGLGGKGSKLNMNAMQSQLNKNLKTAKMKERLREKSELNNKMKENEILENLMKDNIKEKSLTDEELISFFKSGEKVEKTPRKNNKNKKNK